MVTDADVEVLRESLWSTWGRGRQTTDWPTDEQLREAIKALDIHRIKERAAHEPDDYGPLADYGN